METRETSGRTTATATALERVGAINHDLLLSRAAEVQAALRRTGDELGSDDIHRRSTIRIGDLIGVAAEVHRLGFVLQRVQQR